MDKKLRVGKAWLLGLLFAGIGAALAATFSFSFVATYGPNANGLSALYAGTTSTGQSHSRGVATSRSDSAQNPYSFVQANPNNSNSYQGPYYLTRRIGTPGTGQKSGQIDTSFGDNGYINDFGYLDNTNTYVSLSNNSNFQFDRLCVDPGTDKIVVVGTTFSGTNNKGVVLRLVPASATTANGGRALVDTGFNAGGTASGIPGVVFLSTPNGNNDAQAHSCLIHNAGSGVDGTIFVTGADDVYPNNCTNDCVPTQGLLMVAKITGNGILAGSFGTDGIAEVTVSDHTGALIPEPSDIIGNGNESNMPDVLIGGDAYSATGNGSSQSNTEAALVALDRCSGVLDTNFNGTGMLVNPSVTGGPYTQVGLSRLADNGSGAANNLYVFYLNGSTFTGAFVDYSISAGGVPNFTTPASTATGAISVPTGFSPKGGAVLNAAGQAVVSGNTSSNAEALTEIGGSSVLAFTPSTAADSASCNLAATPTFSPVPGTYATSQNVTLSDTTAGAKIYYTLDGSPPTTNSTRYTGAISVSQTTTIKAIAAAAGFTTSAIASGTFTIMTPAAAPTFSPPGGTYSAVQNVSLSDTSAGVTIYYTTDGSTPTTGSAQYNGAINVSKTTTIKAIAAGGNFSASAVASAVYTINLPAAATPLISPASGTYSSTQSVTITDSSAGVTIYYTIDGSTPTTSSPIYGGAFNVSQTTTVKAIAAGGNFSASAVASVAYTINLPAAATPTFNPAPGTYTTAQSVTLSDTSAGVTIYYTTDGSTPTTISTQYKGAFSVSKSATVKAIAAGGNFSSSPVATAVYTIVAATPTFSPPAGTYTTVQNVSLSDVSAGVTIYYTTNGTTPTTASTVYSGPISVGQTTTIEAIAAGGNFGAGAVATAVYTINLPAAATPSFSPVPGTYTSTQHVTLGDSSAGVSIYYTTDGSTPTTASTLYQGSITVSATTTIKAIAAGGNFSASPVATGTYTIQPPAATPTFSPAAGTYVGTQSVTISDTSAGVSIYYTTDGSAPTASSTRYGGAFTIGPVGSTVTVKAIASGNGFSASAVGSASYVLQIPNSNPSPFTFTPLTGQALDTVIASNSITVAGINIPAPISISAGGQYRINGGTFTSQSGTVNNGDTVQVALTSSGSYQTAVSATLTIGTVTGTFTVTTAAENLVPNPFSFTAQTGVAVNTLVQSNSITVSGINGPAPISITGGSGQYSIGCNGNFTSAAGTVTNGQTVCVELTSSANANTTSSTTLIISGVSGEFDVTTASASGGGSFGPGVLGGLAVLAVLRRKRRLRST